MEGHSDDPLSLTLIPRSLINPPVPPLPSRTLPLWTITTSNVPALPQVSTVNLASGTRLEAAASVDAPPSTVSALPAASTDFDFRWHSGERFAALDAGSMEIMGDTPDRLHSLDFSQKRTGKRSGSQVTSYSPAHLAHLREAEGSPPGINPFEQTGVGSSDASGLERYIPPHMRALARAPQARTASLGMTSTEQTGASGGIEPYIPPHMLRRRAAQQIQATLPATRPPPAGKGAIAGQQGAVSLQEASGNKQLSVPEDGVMMKVEAGNTAALQPPITTASETTVLPTSSTIRDTISGGETHAHTSTDATSSSPSKSHSTHKSSDTIQSRSGPSNGSSNGHEILTTPSSAPFETVGRYNSCYKEEKVLGAGDSGVVCLVRSRVDRQKYAIKKQPCTSENKKRMVKEAIALAKLSHRNLVRYFTAWLEEDESGKLVRCSTTEDLSADTASKDHIQQEFIESAEAGTLYIVMAAYPGSLEARLDMEQGLTLGEANRVAREVLSAVAYLHENDVVHGDIHPGNVLFDDAGSAVLIDLGSLFNLKSGSTRLTTSSHGIEEPLSIHSDVHMVGQLLFSMLVKTWSDKPELEAYKQLYEQMTDRTPSSRPSALEALGKLEKEMEINIQTDQEKRLYDELGLLQAKSREDRERISCLEEERRVDQERISCLEEERRVDQERISRLEEERRVDQERISRLEELLKQMSGRNRPEPSPGPAEGCNFEELANQLRLSNTSEETIEKLRNNDIDGQAFLLCNEDNFLKIGIKMGSAKKLDKLVRQWGTGKMS